MRAWPLCRLLQRGQDRVAHVASPALSSLRQAFVKMVGHHVSFLEAHVLQAERDHGAFSQALRRWLGSTGLPSFRNVSISPPPTSSQTPDWGEGLRK